MMYKFLRGPRVLKIVNCAINNQKLLITHQHKPLCFKKVRTAKRAFLISNTVVPNSAFDPRSLALLS